MEYREMGDIERWEIERDGGERDGGERDGGERGVDVRRRGKRGKEEVQI